jgi:hypothetical protein
MKKSKFILWVGFGRCNEVRYLAESAIETVAQSFATDSVETAMRTKHLHHTKRHSAVRVHCRTDRKAVLDFHVGPHPIRPFVGQPDQENLGAGVASRSSSSHPVTDPGFAKDLQKALFPSRVKARNPEYRQHSRTLGRKPVSPLNPVILEVQAEWPTRLEPAEPGWLMRRVQPCTAAKRPNKAEEPLRVIVKCGGDLTNVLAIERQVVSFFRCLISPYSNKSAVQFVVCCSHKVTSGPLLGGDHNSRERVHLFDCFPVHAFREGRLNRYQQCNQPESLPQLFHSRMLAGNIRES